MESRVVFIYGLWDPRDSRLRYIGKTINPKNRLYRHCVDYDRGKITHCSTWIKGIQNDGLEPMMEILEETTESEWQGVERDWIAKARNFGVELVNMHPGGTGGAIPGIPKSEKFKKALSKKFKGRPGYWKGRKHTEEAKQKVSLANTGKKPRLGMKNSQEQNAKIGKANAKALKGRKVSEAEKMRLAQIGIARWDIEGEKEKHSQRAHKRLRNNKGQFLPKEDS